MSSIAHVGSAAIHPAARPAAHAPLKASAAPVARPADKVAVSHQTLSATIKPVTSSHSAATGKTAGSKNVRKAAPPAIKRG